MQTVDLIRRVAPNARACYVQAFAAGNSLLSRYEIVTPLRLAAFLGQAMVETGAFTIERESGNYRAERIIEIFGVGHHSARVSSDEAVRLAGKGPALFERVYGLGNPSKAEELGNTQAGDGWLYRGNGVLQTTGRGNHRRMGEKCGVDFESHPELVTAPEHALKPALAEWNDGNLNALADIGTDAALKQITKRINGGTNGLADRIAWTHKILPLIGNVDLTQTGVVAPSRPTATDKTDDAIKRLQQALADGGFDPGAIDGDLGPKTIKAFQRAYGLSPDGVVGPKTQALLDVALNTAAH